MRPRAPGAVPRAGARALIDLDRVDLLWLLAVVVAGFIFFSPMWTGAPLTTADHDMRLWVGDWR